MTMHLARGLSTLNTKIKKKKPTKAKLAQWQEQHKIHNKEMKRLGMKHHMLSFQDYIKYIHGELKTNIEPVAKTPWHQIGTIPAYRRQTDNIPSLVTKDSFASCTKKEPMQYTGERKLVGIAMMHKSNLVPVFADDDDKNGSKQATEIAQMRRN